jgi:methionyl-tRNA formyltransferase
MEIEGKGVVLAGLLTKADRRRRHGQDEPSELSAAALELDLTRQKSGLPPIPQLKPEKLDAQAREETAALAPDLLVSFAYGRLFGPRFLALFPLGGINIHPSLLPKYRGASPISAAIMAREKETGICIQKLAAELDSGALIAEEHIPLSGRETALSLGKTAAARAAVLMRELLPDFGPRASAARPQQGETIYCYELKKEDGLIDWGKSAAQIDAQIRAYTPWPLSFTFREKDMLFILEAAPLESAPSTGKEIPGMVLGTDKNQGILIQTGDGFLAVSRLQKQAKKALDWEAFCNGERDFIGARLG